MGVRLQGQKGMFVINVSLCQGRGDFSSTSLAPARMEIYHTRYNYGYTISRIMQIADRRELHYGRLQGIIKWVC